MTVLLRKLTLKSQLKIGKYAEYTVQSMIELRRESELLGLYYYYTTIDYVGEVKELLKITPEFTIEKPGSNKKMFYPMLEKTFNRQYRQKTKGRTRDGADIMRKSIASPTKGFLQSKNQKT